MDLSSVIFLSSAPLIPPLAVLAEVSEFPFMEIMYKNNENELSINQNKINVMAQISADGRNNEIQRILFIKW